MIITHEWTKNSPVLTLSDKWSEGFILIQEGVFESSLFLGLKTEASLLEAGQKLIIPLGSEFKIKCISQAGKTQHFYVSKNSDQLKTNSFALPQVGKIKSEMDLKLSSEGLKWEQLLKAVEKVQQHSVSTDSPFFMNQLFSGVLPETILADEVLAKTRSTMSTFEASPALTLVETEVIQKLGEIIGWTHGKIEGLAVPGGSAANFMALHCARQKKFTDYKTNGLQTQQKIKIFVSEEAHYSLEKACVVLGFGTNSLVEVKANPKGEMLVGDLKLQIETCLKNNEIPLMVCATAGTTVFGAFDPIEEISAICKQHNIWFHVDAAWGGPIIFSKKYRSLVTGIEKADSITFDAHKLFGSNMTCSFFITPHNRILLDANDVTGGDYLFHEETALDRGRLSWQCGRKGEALSFWTLWKSVGTDGLGEFVDRLIQVKNQSLTWIKKQERLELIAEPDYLNICVRVKPPLGSNMDPVEWSMNVRSSLREKNLALVNYSTLKDGTTFLRLILAHPQIDFKTVTDILTWALEVES